MRTLQVISPRRMPARRRRVKVNAPVYPPGNFPDGSGVMGGTVMPGPTDNQLLTRARAGDADGYRLLVDRHKDVMVNYLTRMTGCRVRAEEMAQESFVRLYLAPPRVQNGA